MPDRNKKKTANAHDCRAITSLVPCSFAVGPQFTGFLLNVSGWDITTFRPNFSFTSTTRIHANIKLLKHSSTIHPRRAIIRTNLQPQKYSSTQYVSPYTYSDPNKHAFNSQIEEKQGPLLYISSIPSSLGYISLIHQRGSPLTWLDRRGSTISLSTGARGAVPERDSLPPSRPSGRRHRLTDRHLAHLTSWLAFPAGRRRQLVNFSADDSRRRRLVSCSPGQRAWLPFALLTRPGSPGQHTWLISAAT